MKIVMIGKSVILRASEGCVITDSEGRGPWRVKCVAFDNMDLYSEMTESDYWAKYPAPVVPDTEEETTGVDEQ